MNYFFFVLLPFSAEVNAAAKIADVTILPSDDAFGVISFAPDSLSRTVSEASGSTVYLTVQRIDGLLGPSTVYWEVSGEGAHDVENTNGSVVLAVNSNTTQIAIRIKEDVVCHFCFCCYFRCLCQSCAILSPGYSRYSTWRFGEDSCTRCKKTKKTNTSRVVFCRVKHLTFAFVFAE